MTVLRITEDERGTLRFETGLPAGMGTDEQVELLAGLQFGMMASLRGSREFSVYSAIFAVGIASALLCEPMEEYFDRFEKDARLAVRVTREGIRELSKQNGVKFTSGRAESRDN